MVYKLKRTCVVDYLFVSGSPLFMSIVVPWCSVEFIFPFCICRSVSKVHDEWFADEEKVRRAVGLLEKPVVEYPNAREVCSSFFTMLLKFWKLGFWVPCLSLLQLCASWCILVLTADLWDMLWNLSLWQDSHSCLWSSFL